MEEVDCVNANLLWSIYKVMEIKNYNEPFPYMVIDDYYDEDEDYNDDEEKDDSLKMTMTMIMMTMMMIVIMIMAMMLYSQAV